MKNTGSDSYKKKVDRANNIARRIITLGGYGIIVSIAAILLFLLYQSLPLTFGASLKKMFSFQVERPVHRILVTGIDQYKEVVYTADDAGRIHFFRAKDQSLIMSDTLQLNDGEKILSAARGSLEHESLSFGTNQGRIIPVEIRMQPHFEGDTRTVVPSFSQDSAFQAEPVTDSIPAHIELLAYTENGDGMRYWTWKNHAGHLLLHIYDPDSDESRSYDLSGNLGEEDIISLAMSYSGESLIAGSKNGELFWFDLSDTEDVHLRDNWKGSAAPVSALKFLIGGNSLVIGNTSGEVNVWFPVRNPDGQFKFTEVHRFEAHPAAVTQVYASPRNRSFLTIDATGHVHLNFSTTSQTQIKFKPSEYPILAGEFAPKSNGIVVVDNHNRLGQYKLDDEHPEATFGSLFGKVWYEGYPRPEFVWQSTGGSDEFEPKFSLIPLIFGTFKGTLYAMIFSIPLALLAAIYVSQFAPKWLARTVKPTVEIMAALPSVVIGFLAGLYFSPLFERHLATLFLVIIFLPVIFFLGMLIWRLVPEHIRMRVPAGWEVLFMIPLAVFVFWLASVLSGPVESAFFAGNIKQWFFENLGLQYDQRNSIVVGFALGFAVVPIIFTISEDTLSNVPDSLTSASLALGASRWQTVRRVVLPAAAGGIFAAVMLGLGRAIGETMIVLMATGNTPILDLSPFNGFRAMSACIAVEIPEAPVGGTLYRVLFLTAFLLFIFTFIINSVAAFISDRLRKKYSRF